MKKEYKHMTKHRLERELIDLTEDLNSHKLDLIGVQSAKRKIAIIQEEISNRTLKALYNHTLFGDELQQ